MEEYLFNNNKYTKQELETIALEKGYTFDELLQKNPEIQSTPAFQPGVAEKAVAVTPEKTTADTGSTSEDSSLDLSFMQKLQLAQNASLNKLPTTGTVDAISNTLSGLFSYAGGIVDSAASLKLAAYELAKRPLGGEERKLVSKALANTAYYGGTPDVSAIGEGLNDLSQFFKDNLTKEYKYDNISKAIEEGDYDTAAQMTSSAFFQSAPYTASAFFGLPGLLAMGTSVAGNKFREEVENETEAPIGTLLLNAGLTGAGEAVFDLFTAGLFKYAKAAVKPNDFIEAKNILKTGFNPLIKTLFGGAGEAATEAGTEALNAAIDNYSFNRSFDWKDIKYNVIDGGILGFVTGSGIKGIGAGKESLYLKNEAEKILMSDADSKDFNETTNSILENIKLSKSGNLTGSQEIALAVELNELLERSFTISKENKLKLNSMSNEEISVYANNKNRQRELKELSSIPEVTESTKKTAQEEYQAIEEINNNIVKKALERKGTELYKANVENLEKSGLPKLLNATVKRYGVNEQEAHDSDIAEAVKNGELPADAFNATAYFNPKTNEIVLKDYAVEQKQGIGKVYNANVASHEAVHAVVKQLLGDPALVNTFGTELLGYLQEIGSSYMTSGRGARYMQYYLKQNQASEKAQEKFLESAPRTKRASDRLLYTQINMANILDEALARISDGITYGLINENQTAFDKINDLIRRASQKYINAPIQFNSGKDVFNFFKDLNNDLSKGRISAAMQKTLKSNVEGKLPNQTSLLKDYIAVKEFFGPEFKAYTENVTPEKIRDQYNQYLKITKNLPQERKISPAMAVAAMFEGNVIKKVNELFSTYEDYNIYRDEIISDLLYDEKQGVVNLVLSHKAGVGTLDGFVNTYMPLRAYGIAKKYLKSKEQKIKFAEELKSIRDKTGPDPLEVEKQILADQKNFNINTIDKLSLPGNLSVIAQNVLGKTIVTNIKTIKSQAGKDFRNTLNLNIRSELSKNGSELDISLKGRTSLQKIQRVKTWEKLVKNNGKALYETFDAEQIIKMGKDAQVFLNKVKTKDGKNARVLLNYKRETSYAGNLAYTKKPYEEIKTEWENFFVLSENFVKDSKEWRDKTETRYRTARNFIADKIAADQLNFLIKEDQKFQDLLNVQGVELTKKVIDDLQRNLRQGAFGLSLDIETNDYINNNPDTFINIMNVLNEMENKIYLDKKTIMDALEDSYPNMPENVFVPLGSALQMDYLKQARDFDNNIVEQENKNYKTTAPSKMLSDMIDRKSPTARLIKSGKYSDLAKSLGKKRSWFKKIEKEYGFVPYNAEDFEGMLYEFMGQGKQGEADQKYLYNHLIRPYYLAMEQIDTDRLRTTEKLKQLKKNFAEIPNLKLDTVIPDMLGDYTVENAIRIWLFDKTSPSKTFLADKTGLSVKQIRDLISYVESNSQLKNFARKVNVLAGVDGYPMAEKGWRAGNISYDLIQNLNEPRRARALSLWKKNIAATFGYEFKENGMLNKNVNTKVRNKMIAAYGESFVRNFEAIVERMETGRQRPVFSKDTNGKILEGAFNFINAAQANIMFLNARSALLQLISTTNFINISDNNPLAAAKAMANIPQYASDIAKILNSDFIKARKEGTTINIVEADFIKRIQEAKTASGRYKNALSYLLDKGYVLTRAGDSLAIALGGATFYRNRKNALLKSGVSEAEAERVAISDTRETALKAQQSADAALVSNIQASVIGRTVFAFANTPFQYNRIMKKAVKDLVNRRGDAKSHVTKIIYYGAIQNFAFNALQSALLAALGSDDDKDEDFVEEKWERVANGMLSSILRGSGYVGAGVDTLKNLYLNFKREADKPEIFQDNYLAFVNSITDIAPPLDHKLRKARVALEGFDFGELKFKQQYDSPFPQYVESIANGAEVFNIPASRVLRKIENLNTSFYEPELDAWSRIGLSLGWSSWDLGIEDTAGLLGGKMYKAGKTYGEKSKKQRIKVK